MLNWKIFVVIKTRTVCTVLFRKKTTGMLWKSGSYSCLPSLSSLQVVCAVIAACLHYIYLVVFCIMLAEGIEMAVTVLYVFKTKVSRVRWLLILAWGKQTVLLVLN